MDAFQIQVRCCWQGFLLRSVAKRALRALTSNPCCLLRAFSDVVLKTYAWPATLAHVRCPRKSYATAGAGLVCSTESPTCSRKQGAALQIRRTRWARTTGQLAAEGRGQCPAWSRDNILIARVIVRPAVSPSSGLHCEALFKQGLRPLP